MNEKFIKIIVLKKKETFRTLEAIREIDGGDEFNYDIL
jgi:hypothetical protein